MGLNVKLAAHGTPTKGSSTMEVLGRRLANRSPHGDMEFVASPAWHEVDPTNRPHAAGPSAARECRRNYISAGRGPPPIPGLHPQHLGVADRQSVAELGAQQRQQGPAGLA